MQIHFHLLDLQFDAFDLFLKPGFHLIDLFLQPQFGLANMTLSGEVIKLRKPVSERFEGIRDQARAFLLVGGLGEFCVEVEAALMCLGSRLASLTWRHSILSVRRLLLGLACWCAVLGEHLLVVAGLLQIRVRRGLSGL